MKQEAQDKTKGYSRLPVRLDAETRAKLERHQHSIKEKTGLSASLSEVAASLIRTSL